GGRAAEVPRPAPGPGLHPRAAPPGGLGLRLLLRLPHRGRARPPPPRQARRRVRVPHRNCPQRRLPLRPRPPPRRRVRGEDPRPHLTRLPRGTTPGPAHAPPNTGRPSTGRPPAAAGAEVNSPESAGDVVLGGLLVGVGEDLAGLVEFDEPAGLAGAGDVEERGAVADAGGLLHVVRDDDDRVLRL